MDPWLSAMAVGDQIYITLSGILTLNQLGEGVLQTDSTGLVSSSFPLSIAHGGTNATSFATTNGMIYFDGSKLVETSTGSSGQVLTSNGAGSPPTFQSLPTSSVTQVNATSGSASPSAGVVSAVGGNNITTSASTNVLTISVSGTTNHGVQVGNSTNSLTSLAVGTNGQVLLGSTGANPSFATLTSSGSTLTYTPGAGSLNIDLTTPVAISKGGTNATSMATSFGTNYYDGSKISTTATGTSGQVLTSNGAGNAPTYQAVSLSGSVTSLTGNSGTATPSSGVISVAGGSNITTSASSATVTVNLNSSPSVSGSVTAGTGFTATTGNVAITAGNITLPSTNSAGTQGSLVINGSGWLSTYGTANIFLGGCGNGTFTTGSAINNLCIGSGILTGLTTGNNNVALGKSALALGTTALLSVAIGSSALAALTSGTSNTVIGYNAGSSYTSSEGSNIIIGANVTGTTGESSVTRIGVLSQTKCFISGIAGTSVLSAGAVLVNAAGQLGTILSTRTVKENIMPLDEESEKIFDLEPVSFNYKEDDQKTTQWGLIAEDVQNVFPELVVPDLEGNPRTVKYHDLPILLLNELKKLRAYVNELEHRVYELEGAV